MTTTVKITELADIGANLASSTVVPVVNMAGTPITQKTNVGNIANLILEGAGVDYPEASVALLAQTVSNAAQPNITSTGTLASLSVSGNANIGNIGTGGLITATGNLTAGNVTTAGKVGAGTLTVTGNTSLGAVGNVNITGGTSGYVLQTDGAGNLSWVAQSGGGGSYGNSNVAAYLPTYTGNLNGNMLTVQQDVNGNGALRLQGIANGNSTINIGGEGDIDIVANVGNINLYTANNQPWVFGDDEFLTLPGQSTIGPINGANSIGIGASANKTIVLGTNNGSNSFGWSFQPDGTLSLPDDGVIASYSNVGDKSYIGFIGSVTNDVTIATEHTDNLKINLNQNGTNVLWTFDYTGNVTLPGNTFAVKYANGSTVQIGTNTGNIGFNGNAITNTQNQPIIISPSFSGPGNASITVPDNANAANGQATTITNLVGNVKVRSGDGSNVAAWDFANTGVLHFPDGSEFGYQSANITGIGASNNQSITFATNNGVAGSSLTYNANSVLDMYSAQSRITSTNSTGGTSFISFVGTTFPNMVLGTNGPNNVAINVDAANANLVWVFESSGTLSFPVTDTNIKLQRYGMGNLVGYNDGGWVLGEYNGTSYGTEGIRISPGIEGNVEIMLPANQDAANNALQLNNYSGNVQVNANNHYWTFGNDGNLTLPNDANIAIYGNTTQFNTCPNGFLGLNSYDAGGNNIARVSISSSDEIVSIGLSNPITEIDYNWTFATGGGTIFPTLSTQRGDNPSGTITGQTLLFGDATQEAIISTPDGNATDGINSQRLVINPGQGYGSGEGGDIYLWAGRGGNASGSGGDIKIRGGQGGANTSGGSGGAGGYIRIEAGDAASTGVAGYIDVTGGAGGTGQGGGYVHFTGGNGDTLGGEVQIYGGYGQATGGNVNIWGGGTANGQANEGKVNIQTGGNTWIYDASGNLTLPNGGSIYSQSSTPSGNPGNTIILQPAGSGVTTNQQLLIYPTAGDGDHIHLTSGNLYQTELFLGNDNLYVKLANTGNVVINSNDSNGNSAMWTFGTDGNLALPGNLVINGLTNVFGSNTALIQTNDDIPLAMISSNANGTISSVWIENTSDVGNSNISGIYVHDTSTGGVRIVNGNNGTTVNIWDFETTGVSKSPILTVDTLPSPVAGMRAFVSDCNIAPTGNFGVTISNGGSYTTSVWSNGSSWMIG